MTPCQRGPAPSGLPRLRLQDTAITAQGGRERQGGSGTGWIGRGTWGAQGTTIRPAAINGKPAEAGLLLRKTSLSV